MIGIYIPTYRRSHKLKSIARNVLLSLQKERNVELVFILEKDDLDSITVCKEYGYHYTINQRDPKYSSCINHAYLEFDHEMFFCGADDLSFNPGWLDILLEERKKHPEKMVFGTRDFLNQFVEEGVTATHFLVDRRYIIDQCGTIDCSYPVMYEYDHNYVDTEFVRTANYRGVFQPCLESEVVHVHEDRDTTTEKSLRKAQQDAEIFHSRKHLWNETLPF